MFLSLPEPLPLLPPSTAANLGFQLQLEGNSLGGELSRLAHPAMEVLMADNNKIRGDLTMLSTVTRLSVLSLPGNRLRDHETVCIGAALAPLLALQQYDIADNLFDHSRACNVLAPTPNAPAFLQGVVALEQPITDYCGACESEQLQANCAASPCLDQAAAAVLMQMLKEAVLAVDTPRGVPATQNPTKNPSTSVFYELPSQAPTLDPAQVATVSPTANPTSANPTQNPTADLALEFELLRLEARGTVDDMTTYATFRFVASRPPDITTPASRLHFCFALHPVICF